ncbi:tumor necrosis factor receptor superfamily member 6-like [Colossoma macropomum]|uniref:tumor necrosis factor receptor superfamily member 6-like n=1 Tax=Colossoma macropomum TaxID=42526 RepID=UPI001863A315|nr:tumor necrosis factor receptor superfamily member 6-like [Colossoma macropomum]
MTSTTLFALLCFSLSIFCLTEGLKLRKRRQSCEHGTYTDEKTGLECCLCPSGYYVQDHCTQAGGISKCEWCKEGETFMDHANGKRSCELCSPCEDSANREVEKACTLLANTVCRCKDGHYCDKGDECTACYACDTCKFGVKVPCSKTSNTVCNEKTEPNVAAIVAAVVVCMVLLVCVTVFLWKKKKFCFKGSPKEMIIRAEVFPLLEDVDLTDFLPDIAQKLGLQVVKDVTRRSQMLTDVEMENVEHDYPNAEEQTFQLLRKWYQKHGMKGAYNRLVNNLIRTDHKLPADQVQQIVKKGQERQGWA